MVTIQNISVSGNTITCDLYPESEQTPLRAIINATKKPYMITNRESLPSKFRAYYYHAVNALERYSIEKPPSSIKEMWY